MERISLYCHQLNITSKVKADVQNISGELIVSGVSATSFLCEDIVTFATIHVPWGFSSTVPRHSSSRLAT